MKLPLFALAVAYAIFFGCLSATLGELPAWMATHFDITGKADGWMDRKGYLEFICGMAIGLPLFMVGVTLLTARLGRGLNIPNKEYWLAPERRADTVAIVLRFVIALGAMVVVLHACLHLLVVSSNRENAQPHLNGLGMTAMLVTFVAATLIWVVLLRRRFALPEG